MSNIHHLNLYEHNKASYKKIDEALKKGEKVVGIVHATGTGKTFNALKLILDNPDKKITMLVPSNSILEHIKEVVNNQGFDLKRDFPNLTLMNYQSLINLSRKEIKDLSIDLLILDEFHHIGAPVWGERVKKIIETHPNVIIFGMSAYTVRDRGTIYERDMANPDGGELFSNKIVSRYDICDGMLDGVLPNLIYKSAYTKLLGTFTALEKRVNNKKCSKEDQELYEKLLKDAKKRIDKALSLDEMIKKFVKTDDKLIYFCPIGSNIEEIQEEAKKWFLNYIPEEDIVFYKTTSEMGLFGKKNREAFYYDKTLDGEDASKKLRVMFAINQYNEGVHAPNINGVIMGRETKSDIVFFEQLGRALSVRGDSFANYEFYDKYAIEELRRLCDDKGIVYLENTNKRLLIEKLISPYIIDLTNNIEFIKELQNNIQNRIKERQEKGLGNKRITSGENVLFDIEIINEEIHEILTYVSKRLTMVWEDWFELAKIYYEHHGNLNIPYIFKTINGYKYDESGENLGAWLNTQRQVKKKGALSKDREAKLLAIGMVFDLLESQWEEKYHLAQIYYEHHGNLNVPFEFKTINGYEYDEIGENLGLWLSTQRQAKKKGKLSKEREDRLLAIGLIFDLLEAQWEKMYNLAQIYYEHHGNLNVLQSFKTIDGYEYDEIGENLGVWLSIQRQVKKKGKLNKEREDRLLAIGMVFDLLESQWEEKYHLAQIYYEYHGNLNIPRSFKTINGYEYDENGENLGIWIIKQRKAKKKGTLSKEQEDRLLAIGMLFDLYEAQWEEMYNLAQIYYEYHGNLNIPRSFKTINGYEYDKNGENLGIWMNHQRYAEKPLSKEREAKLLAIGMVYNLLEDKWEEKYHLAQIYYEHHGDLNIPFEFKTINGYEYDESGEYLGIWINTQRQAKKKGTLSREREAKLLAIGMLFNLLENQWEEMYHLAQIYYEHYGNLNISFGFKTINGYEYDEEGENLGAWINTQRQAKKKGTLSRERETKLLAIGMLFDFKNNKSKIKELCSQYGIDVKINKDILERISFQEMLVKIRFLEDNNLSIVTNGYLHEIFNISNNDLQIKYGISLEDLVKMYEISQGRNK